LAFIKFGEVIVGNVLGLIVFEARSLVDLGLVGDVLDKLLGIDDNAAR